MFIDESRDTSQEQRPDIPGLVTSTLGLFALSYALIEANTYGWTSPRILASFGIAVASLGLFVLLEHRQRLPMLDLSLFRNRGFSGANAVMLLVGLAMFGVFFYVSLYVQQVLGYSAIEAGASFLPWTLLIVLLAPLTGRLSDRIGARPFVAVRDGRDRGVDVFLLAHRRARELLGSAPGHAARRRSGLALTMAPVTAAAMRSVRPDKAGVGSAVLNSMRQVGGSLGIALMGAIVAASTGGTGRRPEPADFLTGFHHALVTSSAIALAGALIAALTLGETPHPEPEREVAFSEAG